MASVGIGAALFLALAIRVAQAEPANIPPGAPNLARMPVPYDPAVRRGTLSNGLRYAVMHGPASNGVVSIRLGIDVGSYEEGDDERGFAHFIEHMAFRSTRDFPDDAVDGAFAGKGVTFGRDLNAATDLLTTRFRLDLPAAGDSDVSLSLKWLRNVAEGVTFESDGLDKERGVVLAEKAARDNPQRATDEAVDRFRGPGLRSTYRDAIGTEADLRAATPSALRAFYSRWYRPDNAVVVMVGDLPLDVMESRLKSAFETWRANGPPPVRAPRTSPDPARGLDTFSLNQAPLISLNQVCRLGPAAQPGEDSVARVRADALTDIWRAALNPRLAALRNDPALKIVDVSAEVADNGADLRAVCVAILPAAGSWQPGLEAVQKELRRFAESGPTPAELDLATDSVRSVIRGAIAGAPNRTAAVLANGIMTHELTGRSFAEPRQALRAFDLAVANLSTEDIRAAFARDWSGAGPLISVVAPSPPSAESLRSAWMAGDAGRALASYVDPTALTWAYDFGPPGAVASRKTVRPGQFVRVDFRNGVRLNFKRTDFAKDTLAFVVRMGAGRREIDSHDYLSAQFGAAMLAQGGLGKHGVDDLKRLFQGRPQDFKAKLTNDGLVLIGDVIRPNLDDQFEVLAAYVSDPGFRASADPMVHETVNVAYRFFSTEPQMTALDALSREVAPQSPLNLPSKAVLDALNNARIGAILKPLLVQDPIEITVVGDMDEKALIDLTARTFGALPARIHPNAVRPDTYYTRFPTAPIAPTRATDAGPADKAAVVALWPLYVASPARRREEYAIEALASIFNDELRRRVRVDLGKAYAPRVVSFMPDGADQGQLTADVESQPADVDAVLAEVRAIAQRLSAGEISAEQLDAVRAPLLAQDRAAMTRNSHWAAGIAGASGDGPGLTDLLNRTSLLNALTLDEVKKAAADWLAREPIVAIAAPPRSGGGIKP